MKFMENIAKRARNPNQKGNMLVNIVASVGIAGFLVILFVTLSARAYTTIDPWIDTGETIGADVNNAVEQSFEAQAQVAQYIPLFVLLILAGAFLVLTRGFTTGGGGGGISL